MSQSFLGSYIVGGLATGLTVTTGASSAQITIPNCANGTLPRFIRIAATTESYVKLGVSGVTATTNDLLIQPADSMILAVPLGITTVAYIQGTSSGKVNVTPLEMS